MLHLILDTETTTIPGAKDIANGSDARARNISTNLPIVYDIGWTVIDDEGNTIKDYDFLVQETFTDEGREEAYYGNKWDWYKEEVKKGNISIMPWDDIIETLKKCCAECADVCAYNARFDFHKAIPYTHQYLANKDDLDWFSGELKKAADYADNPPNHREADEACFYHLTEPTIWEFEGLNIPAVDIWNMACKTFLDTPQYKAWSIKEKRYTSSTVYFSTNAENCYCFLLGDYGWVEDHTALSDAKIEAKIFTEIVHRYGLTACITIMPCMRLGRTVDFVDEYRYYFSLDNINSLLTALTNYYNTYCTRKGSWRSQVQNLITKLDNIRKDYETMKKFAVTLLYMNYKTGATLNRIIDITIPQGLSEIDEEEALNDAIADATMNRWMDMDFDSVLKVEANS